MIGLVSESATGHLTHPETTQPRFQGKSMEDKRMVSVPTMVFGGLVGTPTSDLCSSSSTTQSLFTDITLVEERNTTSAHTSTVNNQT